MKIKISEIKVKHRDILHKQLDKIKHIQSLTKQSLLVLVEKKRSTEVSTIIKYRSKLRKFSKFPLKVQVILPTFILKAIDCENAQSLFGQVIALFTATEEHVLSLYQPNTSVKELLDEPEILNTIQTGYENLLCVTSLNEDCVLANGMTNNIKCFNIQGHSSRQTKLNLKNDLLIKLQKAMGIYCTLSGQQR